MPRMRLRLPQLPALWPATQRLVIWEDPDRLGYELRSDPLLDVMSAEQWRELERSALAA